MTHQAYDEFFVVGERGQPSGCLVYRPGAFVHELECGKDHKARLRADALANYAIAQARSKPHELRTAILLVKGDNLPMLKWAYSIGAVQQTEPNDVLFTLTPA
jgi:hypothetical protein